MPEMHFHVRWPDGRREACYSPSLVVKDFLVPGESYAVDEFVVRVLHALGDEAGERVGVALRLVHRAALRRVA